MNKKVLFSWIVSIVIGVALIVLLCVSYNEGYKKAFEEKTVIVHCDLDTTEIVYENEIWKYDFMPKQYSDYIENLSFELQLDPDLVAAILIQENPDFNPDAIHRNENGTSDLGLMQLNDSYIWTVFVPRYWDLDIDFNPYNWKHNLFLGMHHIKYLSETLKIQEDIICAYNGGEGNVMNGTVKPITYTYLARVKNNLKLLKETNKE